MEFRSNIYVSADTMQKILKTQADHNKHIDDCLQTQSKVNNNVKIGIIVNFIITMVLALLLMLMCLKVSILERRVEQNEQAESIVLEDNSPELVGD